MASPPVTVGFIGLGRMGRPIARNLIDAGISLAILPGPRRTGVDELVAAGARAVASAAELARTCDVVMTSLPASAEVEAVTTGADGLLAAARTGFVHLDLTSGDPVVTRRLAALYEAREARLLDVGVMGSPDHAASAGLTLMIGSGARDPAALRPLFDRIARRVIVAGDVGAGHTLKLVMGFMGMAIANASAEALTIARASGIDIAMMRDLLGETAMDSGTFQTMAAAALDGDVARRRLTIASGHKDLGYLLGLAADLGISTSVLPGAHRAMGLAIAQGHAESFVPALTSILCAANRVDDR
jgi:3-hydroxyisobutyrate dehydrogenase-like beta-hydroxyacid dehydrogenase